MRKLYFTLFLVSALAFMTGCRSSENATTKSTQNPPEGTPIRLGWLGLLTGESATLGRDAVKAAELAVKEINDEGGIAGRPIELIAEDAKCTPKDAVQAATKLISINKVLVIFGGLCSTETLAAAPLAEENHVVLISGCSSAPDITNAGDYIFRTYPSDSYQGAFAAEYIYGVLGLRTASILAPIDPWGEGIKASFRKKFEALGGTIASDETYARDERDFRTQLAKIKTKNPQAFYLLGYSEPSVAALKQARELGLSAQVFGAESWNDPSVNENPSAEGVMFSVPSEEFDSGWKKKMETAGAGLTVCTGPTYNNVKIIAASTDSFHLIKTEIWKARAMK
jgi:branched-chain amino acid transport system substrate-binding protein